MLFLVAGPVSVIVALMTMTIIIFTLICCWGAIPTYIYILYRYNAYVIRTTTRHVITIITILRTIIYNLYRTLAVYILILYNIIIVLRVKREDDRECTTITVKQKAV